MTTLFLKAIRDIARTRLRSATVVVMVALGVGTYAGLLMSRDSLFHTRDTMYEELHLADLRVITTPADPQEVPVLDDIPGVARHVRRLVAPGSLELTNGHLLSCLIVYMDDHDRGINELEIVTGTHLTSKNPRGVVIEKSLGEIYGYAVGDTLTLNPYTHPTEVTIVGSGVSPQYLIATVDTTVFLPMRGSLGIIYAPMALIESYFGYPLYNEFSFVFEPQGATDRIEQQIIDTLGPLGIEAFIRRHEEFAYRMLEETMKGFSSFIPSLVIVFGVIIFVVTLITADRLVITQRKQIGVLRSLGYSSREISLSYVVIALLLSVAGAPIGALVSLCVNYLFARAYGGALGLPKIIPVVVPRYLVEGWLLATAVVLVACALPLMGIARLVPCQILRESRPRLFRGIPHVIEAILRKAALFTRHGSCFLSGVRNLFRRPGVTATTVLSVALAIGLAGSLSIVLSSLHVYKNKGIEREQWDIMVNFRYPLEALDVQKIAAESGIRHFVPGILGFGQVTIDGTDFDYRLLGFPSSGWMRKLDLVDGRMFISDHERAIILNNNWIDKKRFHLRVGTTVYVKVSDHKESFTIVGLMNDMTVGQAYIPFGTAQELFKSQGKVNGIMATICRPLQEVKERLYGYQEVKEVFALSDLDAAMDEYMNALKRIYYAAVGVTIVIALFFLLAGVLLNIGEREMEFATLRALGYTPAMLSRIVLTELIAEALIAIALSIPIAMVLAYFISYRQARIYFSIPVIISWTRILGVNLWTLILVPLAGLPGLRYVFRLDIGQVLREKVVG